MKIYIVQNTQRITDYSTIKNGSFSIEVNLPDDSNPLDYVWNGSEAVYDQFVPEKPELTDIEQLQLENKELKKGQESLEATVLELADFIFEGGK